MNAQAQFKHDWLVYKVHVLFGRGMYDDPIFPHRTLHTVFTPEVVVILERGHVILVSQSVWSSYTHSMHTHTTNKIKWNRHSLPCCSNDQLALRKTTSSWKPRDLESLGPCSSVLTTATAPGTQCLTIM